MSINLMLCKYIEHNKLYIEQFHDLYIYISSPYIMQLQYSLQYIIVHTMQSILKNRKANNLIP